MFITQQPEYTHSRSEAARMSTTGSLERKPVFLMDPKEEKKDRFFCAFEKKLNLQLAVVGFLKHYLTFKIFNINISLRVNLLV